jgi:ATP-binding cassette subfamily E protein 1
MVIDHDVQLIDLVSDSLIIFQGIPGSNGHASMPLAKESGMNKFLKFLSITYRRDQETGRPRVNKEDSRLDRNQKDTGNYYYVE